jgi:competence protein ComEC
MRARRALLLAAALALPRIALAAPRSVTVAVAANMKPAFEAMAARFQAVNPGVEVKASFGASGNFFAQIANGAPFDLFLSADAESPALLGLPLRDVEAMKVPHHGSADPGLPEVLDRLRPEIAAIEVGPNTYGHPSPPTLAALKQAGVTTYRTDRDGTVTLTVTHGHMEVTTEH